MSRLSTALVAFDERRANPSQNLGTLGSAGDVVWTGTRVLAPQSEAYVALPGVTGNSVSVPSSVGLDIAGDIEIVVDVTLLDATSTNQHFIVRDTQSGSTRIFYLTFGSARLPQLVWWDAGGAVRTATASTTVALSNGQRFALKVELDVDNGAGGNTVRFYVSDTATGVFAQVGTPITQGFVTSVRTGQAVPVAFGVGNSSTLVGTAAVAVHRAIIRNGIGGPAVLDVDPSVLTDMTAPSFPARTGQTVTINRSAGSTYKAEVVLPGLGSRILNGTTDLGTVAALPGLNFGASDSFTVWALVQQWGTPNNNGVFVNKGISTGARWSLATNATALGVLGFVQDGTNQAIDTSSTYAAGSLVLAAMRLNRADSTLAALRDGNLDSAATAAGAVGALTNPTGLRVGITGASSTPQHFRLFAWGIHGYAMTSAELTALRAALLSVPAPPAAARTLELSVPTRTLELTT